MPKLNLTIDPPFEIHIKAGVTWNMDENNKRRPEGGCDYIHLSVECKDQAGLDYILETLGDRVIGIEKEDNS